MRKRKSSRSASEQVGYRRPPKSGRFKKGVSGNPGGRPRGSRNVGSVFRDVMRQKISVTENGRTRKVPALEVMLRRLANEAMRSDPRALRLILPMIERYADAPELETGTDQLMAEDERILAHHLGRRSDALDQEDDD
jgi:hypothetical protein